MGLMLECSMQQPIPIITAKRNAGSKNEPWVKDSNAELGKIILQNSFRLRVESSAARSVVIGMRGSRTITIEMNPSAASKSDESAITPKVQREARTSKPSSRILTTAMMPEKNKSGKSV